MKKVVFGLLVLAASMPSFAAELLTGHWTIDSELNGISTIVTLSLKQEGNKLTGIAKGKDGKDVAVIGEVNDKKVVVKHSVDWEDSTLTVVYAGIINLAGTQFEGSFEMDPLGVEGSFVAKKDIKK